MNTLDTLYQKKWKTILNKQLWSTISNDNLTWADPMDIDYAGNLRKNHNNYSIDNKYNNIKENNKYNPINT